MRRPDSFGLLAGILAAILVTGPGCARTVVVERVGQPPPQPPGRGQDVRGIQNRLQELEAEIAGYRKEGATGRPAGAAEQADPRLAAMEAEQAAALSSKGALADGYYRLGKRNFESLEMQKAKENLQKALDVDPNHEAARALLEDARAALGEHVRGDVGAVYRQEMSELLVKMKSAQITVSNRFNKGVRHFNAEEFDEAISDFEYVLEAAKWFPYHVDLSSYTQQAEGYLVRAHDLKKQKEVMDNHRREEMVQRTRVEEEARRKDLLLDRVRRLYEQAQAEFERENYGKAEIYCAQVLTIDPNNSDAQELFEIARAAKHAQVDRRNLETYLEEWRRQMESILEKSIAYTRDVEFPSQEVWDDVISRRGPAGGMEDSEEIAQEDLEVANKMKAINISLNFSETPLPDVLNWLRQFTQLNIILDSKALQEAGMDPSTIQITFEVENLPFDQAFSLILKMWDLGYRVEDGVIIVTTQVLLAAETVFRMYAVQDLTGTVSDWPAPEISLAPADGESDGTSFGGEEPTPTVGSDELVTLIQDNISKGTWDTAPNSLEYNNGILLVRHTREVQGQVNRLLLDLRRSTGMLVSIEARFLTVQEHFLEDIGVDFRGLDSLIQGRATLLDDFQNPPYTFFTAEDGAGSLQATPRSGIVSTYQQRDVELRGRIENLITNDQVINHFFNTVYSNVGGASLQFMLTTPTLVEAIVRAVERNERARLLTAPRITVHNTQRANIFVANQFTYVQDYDVEVAADAVIADPIVGTVQDGIALDVRPTISADRRYVTLELRPTVAMLDPPPVAAGTYPLFIQTFLGQNTDQTLIARVQIETPRIRIQRVRTTVTMPDGGTLLVGGLTNLYDDDIQTGVPIVSDIPIVNLLFDRKTRGKQKKSLLILVRAKILILEEEALRQRGG